MIYLRYKTDEESRMRQEVLEKWTQIMNTYKESGKTIADFCKEQKMDKSNFYLWRKRINPDVDQSFVKVSPLKTATAECNKLIIHLPGNVKVEVTSATDLKLLRKVVSSLGGTL